MVPATMLLYLLSELYSLLFFFFSSRRRHTRLQGDWSSDVCSSDLHYEQSLRIVDVLENDGRGLNLTWEVRDGIAKHSKGKSGAPVGMTSTLRASTIEGQIMRVADHIAYVNHDIDDAIRAGLIKADDVPRDA